MSVEERTMYVVRCDRCGHVDDEGEYYAWATLDQAVEVASESEWLIADDGKHYCENCVEWDEPADGIRAKPQASSTTGAAERFLVRGEHPIMATEGFDPGRLYTQAELDATAAGSTTGADDG